MKEREELSCGNEVNKEDEGSEIVWWGAVDATRD